MLNITKVLEMLFICMNEFFCKYTSIRCCTSQSVRYKGIVQHDAVMCGVGLVQHDAVMIWCRLDTALCCDYMV